MSKGIITVLLHTVEYDTGNVVIDADAEETLHDIISARIDGESRSIGDEVLELEDEDTEDIEGLINVDVSWRIINPEAEQLKQVAAAIREEYGKVIDEWIIKYDELIKQTTHE